MQTRRDRSRIRHKERRTSGPFAIAGLSRAARRAALVAVSVPLLQGVLCFPDPLGALNFETQGLLNRIFFTLVDSLVRNLLRL